MKRGSFWPGRLVDDTDPHGFAAIVPEFRTDSPRLTTTC